MSEPSDGRDPLDVMAEEFLERYRAGERPALTEFAGRHPGLAERVRELFPALVLMEQLAPPPGPAGANGPARLGEYCIVREVGRGGMGVVYEAVQESLGRRVALKVLPAERCRGKFLERFWREARAAARLHHTNIVPVFGVGQDGGTHYYAMQFIDGRGLDELLREMQCPGRPPDGARGTCEPSALTRSYLTGLFPDNAPTVGAGDTRTHESVRQPPAPAATALDRRGHDRVAARLILQAAEALHHAHAQGVLHRDVKPSNLLLDGHGTLWVADFGLAKADDSDDLTNTDDLVGTLRYMAPERFRGHADARSDVYSLGATLYELLALRPAFDGPDRLRLMDQIAHGTPAPLRQVNPRVPRDLETIVAKAMAREPDDRYATARELAEDLERFLTDRPIRARPVGLLEQALRWRRRHPAVAALSAAVVALLALTALGGWWAAGRLWDLYQKARNAEQAKAERIWDARLAQARAGIVSRLPGQRYKGLEALAEAAGIRPSRELRNEAIACLALTDVRIARLWEESLETDKLEYSTGVAFDATLEHYAFTDAAGVIRVRSADGRDVARLGGSGGPADYLRFSSDGRYLAAYFAKVGRNYRIWDWRAGRVVLETSSGQPVFSLDFHPDGQHVAVGHRWKVEVYALPEGRRVRTITLDFETGWLAYEPLHGRALAVAENNGTRLAAVDPESGRELARWQTPAPALNAVAWQPGGSLLAASAQDGTIYACDRDSPTPRQALLGHQMDGRELAFSPAGDLLLSRGWDGTTRFWDPHGGRELLRVRGASFLQFSRDGRRLAFRGYNTRELGIWELPPPGDCRLLYGHANTQWRVGLAFTPGGRVLVSGAGGGVCFWDTRSGRLLERLACGPTRDVLVDPQGRYLIVAGEKACAQYELHREVSEGGEVWRVGAPQPLHLENCQQPYQLHCDRDGERVLVIDRFRQVFILHPNGPARVSTPVRGRRTVSPRAPAVLEGHPNVSYAALSPDGRLVATGTWRGSGVRVWDAATRREVARLPAPETAGVAFTPDGAKLLVLESEGAYRAYRVDGWALEVSRHAPDTGFTRGYRVAFHPDGRLMAQTLDRTRLRLIDPDTGEEQAVLTVPESQNLCAYQFSPDGRYLAGATVRGAVQLWDLHRLRRHLGELGLDWSPGGSRAPWPGEGGDEVVRVEVTRPPWGSDN